jgi:protoporphyrinogen oxidase
MVEKGNNTINKSTEIIMEKIIILGAGMAGFGASHRLNANSVKSEIYEKKKYYGGNSTSFKFKDGFTFDMGPHISFTQIERIQELFAASVEQRFEIIQARVNNYWKGHWIKHPAQCNLYGLPEDHIVNIIRDFIAVQNEEDRAINNYEDWLVSAFGKTFAETYPMKYGLKFHTTQASNMSIEWIGPRMYRPKLEEVLRGALSPKTADVHYVDNFRYPSNNGFVSFLDHFANQAVLNLDHELISLNPKEKELCFSNGVKIHYDYVISSVPLPELIKLITEAPGAVVDASNELACTTCVIVNIGIDREDISETQWIYFYDEDFVFTRLSFPHMLSPDNAPPGAGSIQAEIYFSKKYLPLKKQPDEFIQPVIDDLRRCGLIREGDKVLLRNAMLIPYANVIFDLDRAEALSAVHRYLDDIDIAYCGRYGEWDYLWTDQSFISGENAAQKVLDKIHS